MCERCCYCLGHPLRASSWYLVSLRPRRAPFSNNAMILVRFCCGFEHGASGHSCSACCLCVISNRSCEAASALELSPAAVVKPKQVGSYHCHPIRPRLRSTSVIMLQCVVKNCSSMLSVVASRRPCYTRGHPHHAPVAIAQLCRS